MSSRNVHLYYYGQVGGWLAGSLLLPLIKHPSLLFARLQSLCTEIPQILIPEMLSIIINHQTLIFRTFPNAK